MTLNSDSELKSKIDQAIAESYADGSMLILKERWLWEQDVECKVLFNLLGGKF